MIRLSQAVCLVAVAVAFAACSESGPTAPEAAPAVSAAADLVGLAAPAPSVSCTVTQVDATHYDATATWSGISATGLEFLDGTTLLAQSVFTHPLRSGSLTVTLTTAPTLLEVIGKTLGVKTPCNLVS